MDEPNQEIEDPADDPEEENVNAEPLIEELPANAVPPPNQTGKKRIRRPDTWKQNRAKIARNSGEAYVDKNIKLMNLRSCENFKTIIAAEEKALAQIEKEIHLRKAEAVRTAKEEFHKLKDDSRVAIIFDLQKTMPTPNVSTSKAYYLRQL
ncbi:hypothetical protein J6590_065573 [Homalodisca vitripennis]|nr:hypothetical protein J6590_065573 [Homalodisca vitripennis]